MPSFDMMHLGVNLASGGLDWLLFFLSSPSNLSFRMPLPGHGQLQVNVMPLGRCTVTMANRDPFQPRCFRPLNS